MRYLAIVQRRRFLGQQELQLLAKELGEYSWSAAQGEVSSEAVSRFSPGTLVIAEINANNQIQRIEDAADHLVALLQSFSRFSESFKAQVEEIESWKQSLIYQSQELSRREAELLVRAQELELQLAQVGSLGPEDAGSIREAAEGDPAFSPTAINAEHEWLRNREQSIEAMEMQLTERQRELDIQLERLRTQQADLHREREALQQQWEEQSATQSHGGLSEEQILQIQAYLQSLYNLADTCEEGTLAEERMAWQADWQTYTQALNAVSAEAAELTEREGEHESARQDFRLRRATSEATYSAWENEHAQFARQQALVVALIEAETAATIAPAVGPDGENVEQLQRQLRDQQREYQQRASLVLQQEEELHAQEAHMHELQVRLAESNGDLGQEEREELVEELEFEKQSCLILHESLSQQQNRLSIEQEKIDRQVTRLQTLVGTYEGTGGLLGAFDQLTEHLRVYQMSLQNRKEQLDCERAELLLLEQQLGEAGIQLKARQAQLAERQHENQMCYSELSARQLDLERRASAIEAQRSGQSQTRPLLTDLEYLIRSLQTQ